MKGIFITFEGPEGCGKTTQSKLLADLLASMGYNVILTHEPGGTNIGEKIRKMLLDHQNGEMLPFCELFLFLASRYQLVNEIIKKQLDSGNIVICSRYTDATLAYQGYGRGIDLNILKRLNDVATCGIYPDLTILLDMEPESGLMRINERIEPKKETLIASVEKDRIEEEQIEFHKKVREGYLDLLLKDPERIKKIDADDTMENVQAKVKELVIDVLEKI